MEEIRSVAVIGLGAMGAAYAGWIKEHNPRADVCGIVRNLTKYRDDPVRVNGKVIPVECRSLPDQSVKPADLIIVAVKSYHLPCVIRHMKPLVGENTLILSLLNGLNSEEHLIRAFGEEHVLYATVIGADANRTEHRVTLNRLGVLNFGEKKNPERSPRVERVAEFLETCRIACEVPEDMEYKLWEKFLTNIGCNQVSTVYQMNYGRLRESAEAMGVMREAQREVIRLANFRGVPLSESDIEAWERVLGGLSAEGGSSMLHDFLEGRPLETEILGDTVLALSRETRIPTPVNRRLSVQLRQMIQERNILNRSSMAAPERIATQLRLDILRQKIKKGEKIAENQLSSRFMTSRSSVRTALQILSNEGLIVTHKNGRREAVEFTEKQVIDLYHFRWMLEQEALSVIFQRGGSIFPLMAQVLGDIERAFLEQNSDTDWYGLDVRFHQALVKSSGNMFLSKAWESSAQLIYTLMNFNTSADYLEEYSATFFDKHRRLYELCLSRGEECFRELEKHIMDAEVITKSLLGRGEYDVTEGRL